jgi:spore coat protein U-like protein
MKFLLPMATAVTAAALSTMPAAAQQATDNIGVSLTVEASCTIDANDLAFGATGGQIATDMPQTTTLSVTCTNGAPFNIGLNDGGTDEPAVTRKMSNGTARLNYNLYREAGHTNVWGNTPGTNTTNGTGTGTAQTFTVYALVPGNQNNLTVGQYTDTITATIWYGSQYVAPSGT